MSVIKQMADLIHKGSNGESKFRERFRLFVSQDQSLVKTASTCRYTAGKKVDRCGSLVLWNF